MSQYIVEFQMMVLLHASLPRIRHLLIFLFLSYVLWSFKSLNPSSDVSHYISNSTLGFQEVFVISLASRTDKQDAMTLASSVTGFELTWVDGVDGSSVPRKAIPSIFDPGTELKVIGCWRAHMNAFSAIITQRLSSALILEDDADWDISLKDQLVSFATGSRKILATLSHKTNSEPTTQPNSPYGDNWDLLWLGHCGSSPSPTDTLRHVMENDPTVPPPRHRVNQVEIPDMSAWPDFTRIVYSAASGFCMYGYAVSFRGAQKLLYHLSTQQYFEAIDLTISRLCGDVSVDFVCISVFPQLFNSHRAAGSVAGDTDIGDLSSMKDTVREKGFTYNIVFSVKNNLRRLIDSETTVKSQWPEDTLEATIRV